MSSKKTTIDDKFADRLRELIEEKLKIKHTDFAKKIGITSGYVSMVVTKKRGPSAELIAGVFIHYSEHLSWLLTGEHQKKEVSSSPFFVELEDWAKESGGSENIDWLKNQIESAFPMFKRWKERKAKGNSDEAEFPSSKVA